MRPEQQPDKGPFTPKIYLVIVKYHTEERTRPNRRVVAAKLTRKAAQHIADQIPGSYIERFIADKKLERFDPSLL